MATHVGQKVGVDKDEVQLPDHIREPLRLVEDREDLLETTPPDRCRRSAAGGLMRC